MFCFLFSFAFEKQFFLNGGYNNYIIDFRLFHNQKCITQLYMHKCTFSQFK